MSDNFGFQTKDDIIIYKLGRIEALLTELQIDTAASQVAQASVNKDIEKRTASLERTRAYALGIIAAISVFGTLITNFLSRYIGMPHA